MGLQTWYEQILQRKANLENKLNATTNKHGRLSIISALNTIKKWEAAMNTFPQAKGIYTNHRERPEEY